VTGDELLRLYEQMAVIRRTEQAAHDLFLAGLVKGTTHRVSVGSHGQQSNQTTYWTPAISRHGRYVAFDSAASNLVAGDTNGVADVFLRDVTTGLTRRVSVGQAGQQSGGDSYMPAISANGRIVAFTSLATNLVAGDVGNGVNDVFVRDVPPVRRCRW